MFDQTKKLILITPKWHTQAWYPVVTSANSQPNFPSRAKGHPQASFCHNKQFTEVGGKKIFRKILSLSGTSEAVSKFITGARLESVDWLMF